MSTLTLTDPQVADLNFRHTKNVDKFYRMFVNSGSHLIYAKEGVVSIEMKVSNRWLEKKNLRETADQILGDWQREPELKDASEWIIDIYHQQRLDGTILDENADSDTLADIIEQLKAEPSGPRLYLGRYTYSNS
jgi:hypothetical protein